MYLSEPRTVRVCLSPESSKPLYLIFHLSPTTLGLGKSLLKKEALEINARVEKVSVCLHHSYKVEN